MGGIYTLKQTFGTKYQEAGQGPYTTSRSPTNCIKTWMVTCTLFMLKSQTCTPYKIWWVGFWFF